MTINDIRFGTGKRQAEALKKLPRLMYGDQPDRSEYYCAAQGLADILATTGTVFPLPHAGAGGARSSAALRKQKRPGRLFGPSEPEKPKLKF